MRSIRACRVQKAARTGLHRLSPESLRRSTGLVEEVACAIQPHACVAAAAWHRPVTGAKSRRFDVNQREFQRLHQVGKAPLFKTREIVIVVKPAALKPAGAGGANGITRRKVARVGAVFEVDLRENELPRKIEYLDDPLFHSALSCRTQPVFLDTLDPRRGQTFIEAEHIFASPRLSRKHLIGR